MDIRIISGVLFFTLSPPSSPRPGLQLEEQEQQGSVGLHFAADGLHGCREQVAHGLVGDAHLLLYLGMREVLFFAQLKHDALARRELLLGLFQVLEEIFQAEGLLGLVAGGEG